MQLSAGRPLGYGDGMRCRYCSESAGWWRRRCRECYRLERVFTNNRGADMGTMMDLFIATGAPRSKLERFLDRDPTGNGTVRDQIAADMANQLLGALGRYDRQTAKDVNRIRKRGNWVGMNQRPRE